jgi:hypothetical protein
LVVRGEDSSEQEQGLSQGMQSNGKGTGAADKQSPREEADNAWERRKSSLPIANGSSLVPPGTITIPSPAVVSDGWEDREVVRRYEGKGREEKNSHKDKEKGQERKHHGSSGGKGTGKNKRK